jgi:DHHC palmitoyltransferase
LEAQVDAALASAGETEGQGDEEELWSMLSLAEYCYVCLAPRPPRSKHTRWAGRCVRRFDHTCPFVGNDVGAGNHRALLGFVAAVAVAAEAFVFGAVHAAAAEARARDHGLAEALVGRPGFCLVFLAVACGLVFAVGLLGAQARLVGINQTTFEELVAWRRREKHNPHDQGRWFKNVAAFVRDTAPVGRDGAAPKSHVVPPFGEGLV